MQENHISQVLDEVSVAVQRTDRLQPETAKKRVQSRIQVEILKLCHEFSQNKTQMVYKTNLNFLVVKKYINTLIGCGFLSCENKRYLTTEKGFNWTEKMDPLLLEVGE